MSVALSLRGTPHSEGRARGRPGYYQPLIVLGAVVVVGAAFGGGRLGLAALIGAAIAVPLLFALRRRPQRGVIALVALVPFDGLRLISPLPQSVSSWKEVVVFATLGATFLAPDEARALGDRRRLPQWAPAAIGLLVLGVASGVAVGGQQALTGFRIDYFYVLLGIAVWRCPLGARERDRLVSVLMATGLLTALFGIAQQAMGESRLNALGYQYNTTIITAGSHLRSFSTLSSNFEFAFFLMLVVLVGVPAALADTRRLRNRMFLASLPVIALGLLFTFTRGAWLGLGIGVLYLGLRHYRILLLAVPVAALAFSLLPGSISSTSLSATSLGERSAGWSQNLGQVLGHPLGVGIGTTGAAAAKVAAAQKSGTSVDTSMPGSSTYQPDNYYYKTVYELGLPGLWLFLLLLGSAFGTAALVARSSSGPDAALAYGVAALVLGAAAASFVATYLEIFPMDLFFWLLITAVAAGNPKSDGVRAEVEPVLSR